MFEQTTRQKKAGLEVEIFYMIILCFVILIISAWFRQDKYLIGMAIGVIYSGWGFFIYIRWEKLKEITK